jgi:2,4-dienoyl-CoA reductase-like NADH-dependent reductase (Old Yellow Enzyme family)
VVGIDAVVEMIARQEVDLVAVGRALLADYRWARKIREDRDSDILPFTPDAMKILT